MVGSAVSGRRLLLDSKACGNIYHNFTCIVHLSGPMYINACVFFSILLIVLICLLHFICSLNGPGVIILESSQLFVILQASRIEIFIQDT